MRFTLWTPQLANRSSAQREAAGAPFADQCGSQSLVAPRAGKIYQFVQNEQDRGWVRGPKISELYKDDLREAFDDLGRLSDAVWKEIDTADEKDWNQACADLGGLNSDSE